MLYDVYYFLLIINDLGYLYLYEEGNGRRKMNGK
jgi:hypothetical protein